MNARYQLVEIVGPVDDEEPVLESNARLLLDYLRSEYPFRSSVVVADDASTDGMAATGSPLGALEPQVSKREVFSRGYNLLVHAGFRAGFSDRAAGRGLRRRHPAGHGRHLSGEPS